VNAADDGFFDLVAGGRRLTAHKALTDEASSLKDTRLHAMLAMTKTPPK
jgi:hypothetical protein